MVMRICHENVTMQKYLTDPKIGLILFKKNIFFYYFFFFFFELNVKCEKICHFVEFSVSTDQPKKENKCDLNIFVTFTYMPSVLRSHWSKLNGDIKLWNTLCLDISLSNSITQGNTGPEGLEIAFMKSLSLSKSTHALILGHPHSLSVCCLPLCPFPSLLSHLSFRVRWEITCL